MITIREANGKVREAVHRFWDSAYSSKEEREAVATLRALVADENIPAPSREWAVEEVAAAVEARAAKARLAYDLAKVDEQLEHSA